MTALPGGTQGDVPRAVGELDLHAAGGHPSPACNGICKTMGGRRRGEGMEMKEMNSAPHRPQKNVLVCNVSTGCGVRRRAGRDWLSQQGMESEREGSWGGNKVKRDKYGGRKGAGGSPHPHCVSFTVPTVSPSLLCPHPCHHCVPIPIPTVSPSP